MPVVSHAPHRRRPVGYPNGAARTCGFDQSNLLAGAGLFGLMAMAMLWLALGGWSRLSGPATDPYGCRADTNIVVFALDATANLNDQHLALLQPLAQRAVRRLAPEDRLHIHALDSESGLVAEPAAVLCAPPAAEASMSGPSATFVDRARRTLEQRAVDVLETLPRAVSGTGDVVLPGLVTLVESLRVSAPRQVAIRVMLYSDFSDQPEAYAVDTTDLSGIPIEMVQASRGAIETSGERAAIAAWRATLSARGAILSETRRVAGSEEPAPVKANCKAAPSVEILAIIDATGPYAPSQWAHLGKTLAAEAEALPETGVLELHRIETGRAGSIAERTWRICGADGPEATSRAISDALDTPGVSATSPIMEEISARFSKRMNSAVERRVIMFSDFLFNSDLVRFLENGIVGFAEVRGRLGVKRTLVDFDGAPAMFLYARRDREGWSDMQGPDHRAFVRDWATALNLRVEPGAIEVLPDR